MAEVCNLAHVPLGHGCLEEGAEARREVGCHPREAVLADDGEGESGSLDVACRPHLAVVLADDEDREQGALVLGSVHGCSFLARVDRSENFLVLLA